MKKHKEKRPFIEAIENSLKHFPDNIAAWKHWAQTDPKVNRTATIAEKFDSCVISRFNGLLFYGMLYRCVKDTKNEKIEKEVLKRLSEWNEELEKQLNYKVIPIQSLVRVQLGSALFAAEYVRSLH